MKSSTRKHLCVYFNLFIIAVGLTVLLDLGWAKVPWFFAIIAAIWQAVMMTYMLFTSFDD